MINKGKFSTKLRYMVDAGIEKIRLNLEVYPVRKKGTVGVRLQTLRVQMMKLYPQWVIVAP